MLATLMDKNATLHRLLQDSPSGDGKWGQLQGAYFLAEGDDAKLAAVFAKIEPKHGKPVFGGKGQDLAPIPNVPLAPDLIKALGKLPEAKVVAEIPTKSK